MGKTFSTGLLTNGIWQDASNNIGIGGSPSGSYKLEVNGKGKFSNDLTVQHNQNASSTSTFSNSDTTGLGSRQYLEITAGDVTLQLAAINTDAIYLQPTTSVSTYLGYNSAGGNALYLKPNGNVLVNTNTDAGYKLDVNGTGRFTGALTALSVTTTATSSVAFYSGTYVSTSLGDGSFGTYSSRIRENTSYGLNIDLYDRTAATWRTPLSFNNTGGAATFSSSVTATSSSFPLDIYGTTNNYGLRINNVQAATLFLYSSYANADNRNWGLFTNSNVFGDFDIRQSNAINGDLTNGANSTSRLYIKNDGNVGIGTSSPDWLLKIEKNSSTGGGGTYPALVVNNPNAAGYSAMYFFNGATNVGGLEYNNSSTNLSLNAYGALLFQTASGYERMRITSGGDVCIGTTTVSDKLTINGGIRSMGSGGGYFFDDRSNSSYFYGWYSTGNTNVYFFNGNSGSNIASISPSTGVYTPLSDINKKKDFELSTIGLKEVLQLKPTLYRMKSNETNGNKELGFIAQEVKEFIPQAYVESEDFIGLNYNAIVAALVKSVQELKAEIDELKNK